MRKPISRSRIKRQARTIPLHGDDERGNGLDHGTWFRCWNCGFICSVDRDSLGGAESRDGVTPLNYTVPVHGAETAIPNSGIARLGGPSPLTVALKVDDLGQTQTIETRFAPEVSGGCPFCGSLNWRGDYP